MILAWKNIYKILPKIIVQNLTHFGRYLRTCYIFFKPDFCIEIVSLSQSFEYQEPFFHLGVRAILLAFAMYLKEDISRKQYFIQWKYA